MWDASFNCLMNGPWQPVQTVEKLAGAQWCMVENSQDPILSTVCCTIYAKAFHNCIA